MIFRASICVPVVIEAPMEGVGKKGVASNPQNDVKLALRGDLRAPFLAHRPLVGVVPPVKLPDFCWPEVFELDSALAGLEPNMV